MWIEYPSEFGSARLDLGDEIITIGRDEACRICINDPSVSTLHAKIERTASGWFLTDFGSTNGTFLNGAPVTRTTVLASGDTIAVGSVTLVVHGPPAAGAPPATTSSVPRQPTPLPRMAVAACYILFAIIGTAVIPSLVSKSIAAQAQSGVPGGVAETRSVQEQIRDLEAAIDGSANVRTAGGTERDLARLYLALGGEQRAKGETLPAEAAYRRVTELAPDFPDGHEALGRLYQEEAERTARTAQAAETWSASADSFFAAAKVAGSIGERWRLQELSAESGYKAALLMSQERDADLWRTRQVLELARARAGSTMKIMSKIEELHSELRRREHAGKPGYRKGRE